MGKRHNSRVIALKILYSLDIKEEFDYFNENYLNELKKEFEDLDDFSIELLNGVISNLEKIDGILKTTSKNWKVDRMSIIDRNILRIGIFELMNNEPAPVVINEAILLAKNFGSDNSTSFVNGILDHAKGNL